MAAVVQLINDNHSRPETVRFSEVPQPGDVIEAPDGTRLVVRAIEIERRPEVAVEAYVRVKPAS
jgi:hypothetical protein